MEEETEKKKGVRLWVVIVCSIFVTIAIAAGVFFGLAKTSEVKSYREAKEQTDEILETRSAVTTYFDLKSSELKIADENKVKFEEFENAVRKSSEIMEKMDSGRSMENEAVKQKYDEAFGKLGELQRVAEIEQILMDAILDGELSNEELDEIENSDSEYLKTMAVEMKKYREEATAFNEKYADLKGKDKKVLDEDYAKIQQSGNELSKKYAEIGFEDVYGKSSDDILDFYATIEELNKILAEKI